MSHSPSDPGAQPPRKHVFTEVVPIRWGDMDAMGHVNNTVYFRYMEQARIAWFDSLGVRPADDGIGPILMTASCTFLKQVVYPGDVEVKMFAGQPGRSSFETWIEMRPSYDPATIHATGSAKIVWADYSKGKSVPLPEKIRQIVGG